VKRCRRCKYPLPTNGNRCQCRNRSDEVDETPHYIPTPEQIREGCRAIQATWSEAEEHRRNTRPARGWQPPEGRYIEGEQ
jgi:hypothetical protein